MKAVISTTYDDKYLWFLPIVTYCWNKLGVDVICFMPERDEISKNTELVSEIYLNIFDWHNRGGINSNNIICGFRAAEHKEATYAQCSRLYAACLDLPEDEILFTSDVDMAVFKLFPTDKNLFCVFGNDLVPEKQYPVCYISAEVHTWRKYFNLNNKQYQQCLDELLGGIDCENMRGNYWGKDQEELYNKISPAAILHNRARPGTQFAEHRIDREDINWRSYMNENLIDAHLWRPGYTEENFANIMELMTTMYPNDDFIWLMEYRNQYIQLL